ncbi:unnamed protein product [Rotaria sordida]|uniref:Uncharacterized protein n=1 Tax=Rotaria sordida TaxID=392033 RepID=A0A815ZFQ7_9BILA|nr:unnamed protein product [Rotaria sordida]CAF1581922.1 unnamed protein product [Rotaria sordida]
MAGRTPSFIFVGIVMIVCLVGIFYMSCSSQTNEFQETLASFERRIRTLAEKNLEKEKEIESISGTIRDLENEKTNIQQQIEQKDSEINNLNTKLNERKAQIQNLKYDKQFLDNQLIEFKTINETLASKNIAIEKLQEELDEEKKSHDEQLNRLKQEINNYEKQLSQSQNNQENSIILPNQRFQPLLLPNETIKTSLLVSQEPLAQFNQIKSESKEDIPNSLTNQTIPTNEKQQEQLELSRNESVSVLPKNGLVGNSFTIFRRIVTRRSKKIHLFKNKKIQDQELNNSDFHQRLQRSLNNSLFDNQLLNDTDNNNNMRLDIGNAQKTINITSIPFLNETNISNNQSQLSADNKNSPIDNYEQNHQVKDAHEQRIFNID